MSKLNGLKAIKHAELTGAMLHKYADAIDGAREVDVDEARRIAREDASLIWCAVDLTDIGIQLAERSIDDCAAEDRCSRSEAARLVLAEGMADWRWPEYLTPAQVAIVERDAAQQLANHVKGN